MNKIIFLIFSIIFSISIAIADNQNYDLLLQKQSKQIQELQKKTLELENTIEDLKTSISHGITSTDKNHEKLADEKPSNATNSVAPSASDEKSDYDLALADLQGGNFEDAEKKFSDFIVNHPSSKLQSNATFWYSETFYRRSIFDKAAINYLQNYKKFPKGVKAPDALLKLSYSLGNLNKNKEACSMLDKLESEFPKRPISSIKRANEAKSKFHCK